MYDEGNKVERERSMAVHRQRLAPGQSIKVEVPCGISPESVVVMLMLKPRMILS